MPTPIAADDLCPDMWVTLRPVPEEEPLPPFLAEMQAAFQTRRCRPPRMRPGTPLRILAVDLPNLYVAVLDPDGDEVGPIILDIREQPVLRLDDSVPEAIRRFARVKREQCQQSREDAACRAAEVEAAAKAARRRRLRAERGEDATTSGEHEKRRQGPRDLDEEIREAVQRDIAEMKRRRLRRRRPGGERDGGPAA